MTYVLEEVPKSVGSRAREPGFNFRHSLARLVSPLPPLSHRNKYLLLRALWGFREILNEKPLARDLAVGQC